MADDDSPRPFRRERNLSNRNFARRGSRRRFSTESHSSIDSSQSIAAATESHDLSSAAITTAATTCSNSNSSSSNNNNNNYNTSSSSMHISYSVNSDTENAFNRKSLLKMRPATDEVAAGAVDSAAEVTTHADPALLGVKQKVLRFETLQTEDRIIFKTGKYHSKTLPMHAGNAKFGPLRVLPMAQQMLQQQLQQQQQQQRNGSMSPQNTTTTTSSFHTSIDEERSEDEVDEISEFAEDVTSTAGVYILPEEACELTEDVIPSPTSSFATLPADNGVYENVHVLGIDDFGKVESVRRAVSVEGSALVSTTFSHSSEHSKTNTTPTKAVRKGNKDFPRNYRSTPRPKTEIIGTTNRPVVGKFNSLYQPKEDDAEEEEEIELRDKCDKFIQPILEELIKTEETYVENLFLGIANYGNIFQRKDLPIGLRGKKYVLLGNIEQLAEFHRDEFLPMLKRNRRDLKRLFDEFQIFIDQNCFYGYVIFTMNKQRSLKLCDVYKNYFKLIQSELDDKLGINSFLVQPIQRMARYPLLLQQFISTLFKNRDFVMKPLIESCCRLEKKLRTLLTTTNESEVINDIVDCNEFNVFYQGKFRKVSEFNVFDHTLKRSYRAKVFIFDKCIIYTEIKSKNLVFHGRYPCEHIGILAKPKCFTLFYERRKQQECDFSGEPALIETWLELIRDMINSYANEERQKLHELYSRENDHLHRKPPSLSLYRDSNRFSSDSGIGNIWVMPKPEIDESTVGNRTTWYAVT